jgi:1-deoxy-D-xylulose-5-phosphate reductoisomerase
MALKTLNILGVTGSIGKSTLQVVNAASAHFQIGTITAQSRVEELAAIALKYNAKCAVIGDENLYPVLKDLLGHTDIKIGAGRQAIIDAAAVPADITMAAIMGMAGLEPLMAAIKNSKAVAVANKEPLVAAGPVVMAAAAQFGTKILPVDSEHNAIFQGFEPHNFDQISRIVLTASGGPFRTWEHDDILKATPAQAIAHPNWSMGAKISVDSASMMNKALEVIEAHYLFNMPGDKIDVLVHPQSVIHSMVEYTDGSFLAQLGAPDMCTPIAYCLAWPERMPSPGQKLDITKLSQLNFEMLDNVRFPTVGWAYDALSGGLESCIRFNAYNEVAVAAFLDNKIQFGDIFKIVAKTFDKTSNIVSNLDDIIAQDLVARADANQLIALLS